MTKAGGGLWARENLHAWCVVQYDANPRGPRERAEMLSRLGFHNFAYDWCEEHIPTFDAEVKALKQHDINLLAWWMLDSDPEDAVVAATLEIFERNDVHPQLWVTGQSIETPADFWSAVWPPESVAPASYQEAQELLAGMAKADAVAILNRIYEAGYRLGMPTSDREQEERVRREADRIHAFAELAVPYGCKVELYNHGGWFGMVENQLAILARLRELGAPEVGLVYNFIDARDACHDDTRDFERVWRRAQEYVDAVNIAGIGQTNVEVVNPSQGECELEMMRVIEDSGWCGPIGLYAHAETQDAEATLRDRLAGFNWLAAELQSAGSGGAPMVRPIVERW